jgi:hypothetical protein
MLHGTQATNDTPHATSKNLKFKKKRKERKKERKKYHKLETPATSMFKVDKLKKCQIDKLTN